MEYRARKVSCWRLPQRKPFILAPNDHAPAPETKVNIVVKGGQVSEVYVEGADVHVTVLDLDTDDARRDAVLQRKYALLLARAKSGEITDIL